jgi:hypothetical protein
MNPITLIRQLRDTLEFNGYKYVACIEDVYGWLSPVTHLAGRICVTPHTHSDKITISYYRGAGKKVRFHEQGINRARQAVVSSIRRDYSSTHLYKNADRAILNKINRGKPTVLHSTVYIFKQDDGSTCYYRYVARTIYWPVRGEEIREDVQLSLDQEWITKYDERFSA